MTLVWDIIKILAAGFFLILIISIGIVFFPGKKAMEDKEAGVKVLQYGWFIRGISVAIIIGSGALMSYLYVTEKPKDVYDLMWMIFLIVMFASGGIFLVVETYGKSILFGDMGIMFKSVWKKTSMTWEEIVEVKYTASLDCFTLRSCNGRKLRVPNYIVGLEEFMKTLKRRRPDLRLEFKHHIFDFEPDEGDYKVGLYIFPEDELGIEVNFNSNKLTSEQLAFLKGVGMQLNVSEPPALDLSKARYFENPGQDFNTIYLIFPHNIEEDVQLNLIVAPDEITVGVFGLNEVFNDEDFVSEAMSYFWYLLEATYVVKSTYRANDLIRKDYAVVMPDGSIEDIGWVVFIPIGRFKLWINPRTEHKVVSFIVQ